MPVTAAIGGAYVLSVNGVEQALLLGFTISEVANGRNRLDCRVRSWDGTIQIPLGSAVALTEDGVRIFGGIVETPVEAGLGGQAVTALEISISAMDNNGLAERRLVNITLPAGTLKSWLQLLLPYLQPYGVTLDPLQVDGPTFDQPLVCSFLRVDEVLSQISALAGGTMIWEIDYYLVFRMKDATTTPAPFNVNDGDGHTDGDISTEPSTTDYGNRILVLAGEGLHEVTDEFTGDGTAVTFRLNYAISAHRGYVTCGGVNETLGDGATWEVDPSVATITRDTPPGPGVPIQIIFTAPFPMLRYTEPPGGIYPTPPNIWERLVREKDIFDFHTAQALADAYYTQMSRTPRTVHYRTKQRGIHPGMTQHIRAAARHLDADCLITEVRTSNPSGMAAVREVTAVEGNIFSGTWRDMIASWNQGGSAVGVPALIPGGGGPTAVPAVSGETPVGAINGSNTVFTTAAPYGGLAVFLNGIRQSAPAHYLESAPAQFTMTSAPLPGDVLRVDYGDMTGVSTRPPAGSGGISGTGTPDVLTKWVGLPTGGIGLADSKISESGSLVTIAAAVSGWSFTGSGVGLTNLPADQLIGTLPLPVQNTITQVGTIVAGTWQASLIGAAYGGTGQNSAAWSGVPTISAGTWRTNDVLTATRLLIAAAGNAITSNPNLTLVGATLTIPATLTTPIATDLTIAPTGILALSPAGNTVTVPSGKVLATTYASGWSGSGYTLNYNSSFINESFLEVDRLSVRGTFNVYELLVHQVRATNGSIFVANSGVAKTVTGGAGTYAMETETVHGFAVNDLIRAQRFTGTGVYVSDLTVTAVADTTHFTATLRAGYSPPAAGMEFVRLGNLTDVNRQGSIYLTADDTNAPYINVLDGVAAFTDWGGSAKTRVRMGNLNGSYGYTANTYGIAMGDNAGAWVKLDNTNGIRIGNATATWATIGPLGAASFTGSVTVLGGNAAKTDFSNVTAPYASSSSVGGPATRVVGALAAAPSGAGLYLGSDYLGYFSGASWRSYLNNSGQFFLNDASGTPKLSWDNTTLTIIGNGTFSGALAAATGTFVGTVSAAGGAVILDSNGIAVSASSTYNTVHAYNFTPSHVGGTEYGLFAKEPNNVTRFLGLLNHATSGDAWIEIEADSSNLPVNTAPCGLSMWVSGVTGASTMTIYGGNLDVESSSVTVAHNLTVGGSIVTQGYPVMFTESGPTSWVQYAVRQSGYIQYNSDIGAIGVNYFASDRRLKRDLAAPEADAVGLLRRIEFVAFTYREDSGLDATVRHQVGFVAQQLREVDPRFTFELIDRVRPEAPTTLVPDATVLLPYTMYALQQTILRTDELEARVAALEGA